MLNEIDLAKVDLNLLALFEVVLRERHVGRAADRLNLTPSAVSHSLGRLRRLLNDPLFLKTPKGVVPTERAVALEAPIAEALARLRSIISTAGPFDPATSKRRFTIGAPDGTSGVLLLPLLAELNRSASSIDIGIQQLLPVAGELSPEKVWRSSFTALETRAIDVAIIPSDEIPTRFSKYLLYEESFVLAMRAGHPFRKHADLDRYCEAQHLVVSLGGDPHGFVDQVLAQAGRSRRVMLTVPNFMLALALVAQSDLICAVPRRFAEVYAARFDVVTIEAPLSLGRFNMNIVIPEVAMMDAGVAWLVASIRKTAAPHAPKGARRTLPSMIAAQTQLAKR